MGRRVVGLTTEVIKMTGVLGKSTPVRLPEVVDTEGGVAPILGETKT